VTFLDEQTWRGKVYSGGSMTAQGEAATLPNRPTGEIIPSEQPRLSYVERVPVGVVGVIAPFNFPQILGIRSVAPALALGNAVVLKPDPRTASCIKGRSA
jgi:benzaldehyde dehydrogenase (NAD)